MLVDMRARFAYKKSARLLGTKTLGDVPEDWAPSQLRRFGARATAVLLT